MKLGDTKNCRYCGVLVDVCVLSKDRNHRWQHRTGKRVTCLNTECLSKLAAEKIQGHQARYLILRDKVRETAWEKNALEYKKLVRFPRLAMNGLPAEVIGERLGISAKLAWSWAREQGYQLPEFKTWL